MVRLERQMSIEDFGQVLLELSSAAMGNKAHADVEIVSKDGLHLAAHQVIAF